MDYTGQGFDQLQAVIRDLKENPFSRRIGMTAYNVADLEKGVLHPCHGIFVQFHVEPAAAGKPRLSCHMYQRSMDTFLGAPFNIASYAALTHLLATICDMEPNDLIISTGDTHIYKDHIDAMREQISRRPFPQPHLKINARVKTIALEEITEDDFELSGYIHHQRIYGRMSV
jgi:thymidylate synthase